MENSPTFRFALNLVYGCVVFNTTVDPAAAVNLQMSNSSATYVGVGVGVGVGIQSCTFLRPIRESPVSCCTSTPTLLLTSFKVVNLIVGEVCLENGDILPDSHFTSL